MGLLRLVLVLSSVCAAAAPVADVRSEAADLERRLTVLTVKANLDRDIFTMSIASCATLLAAYARYAPSEALGLKMIPWKAEVLRRVQHYHAAALANSVEATLMARRLKTYRETGLLPPDVKDDGSLLRQLESDIPSAPEVAALSLDLATLAKQLGLPSPPARTREVLPAAPLLVRRTEALRPPAEFMRDAGKGKATTDPVPELIVQLSSENPRMRAFAADELGGRGAVGAPAVEALRRALSDADARVRSSSVTALGSIVPPDSEAVFDIRRALADANQDVRYSARAALRRLGF